MCISQCTLISLYFVYLINLFSVLGRNLNDEQKELADAQNIKHDCEREVASKNQAVMRLEQQMRGMSAEVDRIHNRDQLKEKVVMYDVRLAVLVLEDKAAEVERKQAAIDQANKDLAE